MLSWGLPQHITSGDTIRIRRICRESVLLGVADGVVHKGTPRASFACAADRIAVTAGTESEGLHAGEGDLRLCVGRDGELIRHRAVGIVALP